MKGGTSGAPFKPLRDDSVLRALSSLRGLRGAPEVPPLCRETQSLGQQMLERMRRNSYAFPYDDNIQIKEYQVQNLYDVRVILGDPKWQQRASLSVGYF